MGAMHHGAGNAPSRPFKSWSAVSSIARCRGCKLGEASWLCHSGNSSLECFPLTVSDFAFDWRWRANTGSGSLFSSGLDLGFDFFTLPSSRHIPIFPYFTVSRAGSPPGICRKCVGQELIPESRLATVRGGTLEFARTPVKLLRFRSNSTRTSLHFAYRRSAR